MDSIIQIHERVLQHLLSLRETNKDLFFVPRKINNKHRLEKGYWFIGGDGYVHLSFWNGMDTKEKIHTIGFVVHDDNTSKIELSAQDSPSKAKFLQKVAQQLGGFEKHHSKSKWFLHFSDTDYINHLDTFIKKIKPRVDSLIESTKPKAISPLNKVIFNEHIGKILQIRDKYDFGIYADVFESETLEGKAKRKSIDEKLVSYAGRYLRRAIHNRLQNDILDILVKQYGDKNVRSEENFVDIVVTHDSVVELIEVKPYESVILCVREGLGQLLSYYHKSYSEHKTVSLKIIGPKEPNATEQDFIKFIKRTVLLEFEYESHERMCSLDSKMFSA